MKKIIWTTSIQEIEDTPELHIKKTKEIIPDWFKKIKVYQGDGFLDRIRTVKTCPSFAEIFNEGYVMVSPVDIYVNIKKDNYEIAVPNGIFKFEDHSQEQFLKYANIPNAKYISKFISSWHCITPKGYSLRQMPMFYEEQPDFYVPYGVVKTDYSHEINPQLIFNGEVKEILIKQGQPLAIYVPYKRKDKLDLSIESFEKHKRKINSAWFYTTGSTFRSNYHKYD